MILLTKIFVIVYNICKTGNIVYLVCNIVYNVNNVFKQYHYYNIVYIVRNSIVYNVNNIYLHVVVMSNFFCHCNTVWFWRCCFYGSLSWFIVRCSL